MGTVFVHIPGVPGDINHNQIVKKFTDEISLTSPAWGVCIRFRKCFYTDCTGRPGLWKNTLGLLKLVL